ncbi:hypothetical protein TorRG33x02_033760, partial [Trema orientale]
MFTNDDSLPAAAVAESPPPTTLCRQRSSAYGRPSTLLRLRSSVADDSLLGRSIVPTVM